jgi:hypothetical protein
MMLALAAVILLVVLGVRDSLLLLCSARPGLRMRLVLWAALYLALSIACWQFFEGLRLSPMLWAASCGGHLLRWVAANWFDLRPWRNGLVWVSAVIPAPSFLLALFILGFRGSGAIAWCGLVATIRPGIGLLFDRAISG